MNALGGRAIATGELAPAMRGTEVMAAAPSQTRSGYMAVRRRMGLRWRVDGRIVRTSMDIGFRAHCKLLGLT